MSYRPSQISEGRPPEFRVWLHDELRRISQAFEQLDNVDLVIQAAEPARFAEGLVQYFDGVGFDPGDGAGPYYRSASDWVKMDGSSAVSNHGGLTGLLGDDHTQYGLLAGRTGGQTYNGGLAAGETLTLRGSANSPDTGIIIQESPINVTYDTISNTTPAEAFAVTFDPTVTISGPYIGGYLSTAYDFTVNTGIYIPATFSDTSVARINAVPGFAAYTWCNVLNRIQNLGNFNLPSALVMNVGLTHARTTSGTSTAAAMTGMSFSPQVRAEVSGAVMNRTAITALRVSPTHSTVIGSTVSYGTIVGVDIVSPNVALFQTQGGTELMTALYALRVPNITFGGGARIINVINTQLAAATNVKILNSTGSAPSTHNGNFRHEADLFGTIYGASQDVHVAYAGGTDSLFYQFTTTGGDQLHISNPSDTIIEFNGGAAGAALNECNFVFDKGAFGEGGAAGNNKYRFVAQAETVTIGGEYSQFLLTQAANDTIDAALGVYAGWTINAPSPSIGTGSVDTGVGLNVGGNPTGTVNKAGVRIISNPTGASGVNAALWIPNGETELGNVLRMVELAASAADVAGKGQFWVRDDTPNLPMFTDDAGTDHVLNAGGSPFATPLRILADINTATPPTTEAVTGVLEFRDLANDDTLGSIGFTVANDMIIRNFMRENFGATASMTIGVDDAAGGLGSHIAMLGGTNGSMTLGSQNDIALQVNAGDAGIAINGGADVRLHHNNVRVAETIPNTAGGFRVDNAVTGTAGVRTRVLTIDDLPSVGYSTLRTQTDAQLDDITDAVNTDAGKVQGASVYNASQDVPVWAVGNADGSLWVDGAGTTVNTPV